MKRKDLVLGAVAIFLAIGSAYASLTFATVETPRAKIKYSGDQEYTCQILPGSCTFAGSFACRININLVDYRALGGNGCVFPLYSTDNNVKASFLNPYINDVSNPPL